jgi:AraC-like DNA-binding protein
MAEHLTLSPQLAELAALAAVSVPHYSAVFRRLTGYSPVNYHTRLRLQRACFLLDTTGETINRIAQQMGFEDTFYFSRIFRKIVGYSPRQYRLLKKG